ncbi:MAG: hypothetical protein JHC87_06405 [Thermoleophilaceae bacterium]|nr:hypothetical protein [Thermoleophilaceae bacterium]
MRNGILARKTLLILASCLIALSVIATAAFATISDLDPSFGDGGKVTTSLGGYENVPDAMQVQSDGKIVVVGYKYDVSLDFALVRYEANGALDQSFGNGGIVSTPVGSGWDSAAALDIQSDGKIVVAGHAFNGVSTVFAVVRYLANGALDPSFGNGGQTMTAIGSNYDYATSVKILSSGKIVVAGASTSNSNSRRSDFAVAQYDANGVLDESFGTDGRVTTAFGNFSYGFDGISALQIQDNGKIVAAGQAFDGDHDKFVVARYDENGDLDENFGQHGKTAFYDPGFDWSASAVELQPDGKIVVVGQQGGGNAEFAIARYDTSGNLDLSFDSDGLKMIKILDSAWVSFVHIQPDGKIFLAGGASGYEIFRMALARVNGDGELDQTFGANGVRLAGSNIGGSEFAIPAADKLLVAGSTSVDSHYRFALYRFGTPPIASTPLTPPAPDPVPLSVSINRSLNGKYHAADVHVIDGLARGTELSRVEIAVNLSDKKSRKSGGCLALKDASGSVRKFKAVGRQCQPKIWLRAGSARSWRFKLKKKLRPGNYTIFARAIDSKGNTTTEFSSTAGSLANLKIVR